MKRIVIALAVLLPFQVAVAQVKSPADAKKAVEAAEAAAANAKKAAKVTTWTKLAKSYMDAYNAPAGNAWVGGNQQEIKLVMGNQKPSTTEAVTVGGEQYTKEVYADKNFYYNASGVLSMIEVTKPVFEDALGKALDAYKKAYSLDAKGSKTKEITEGIATIAQKYLSDGMDKYQFGDYPTASKYFENAAKASETAPNSKIDTSAYYNAGFTAWQSGDNDKAIELFTKCYDLKYYFENGEVFAKLADLYTKKGDKAKSQSILEEGFKAFPQSQSILIGLINSYIESGSNTDKLFNLLGEAQKNEPNNASLYYVEGNIHKQLNQMDEAVASYRKSFEINPNYEFGLIGEGILYYEDAIKLSEAASTEFDDAKYMKLVEAFEGDLMKAIDPFEKAYSICKDESIKVSIAEYLKNIYYRFRDRDAKYQTGYDKYNEVVKAGVPAK